jgi:hypothetical protein
MGKGPRGFLKARWPGAGPVRGQAGVCLWERHEAAGWVRVVWNVVCEPGSSEESATWQILREISECVGLGGHSCKYKTTYHDSGSKPQAILLNPFEIVTVLVTQ